MYSDGLADDEAIRNQFADGLAGICVGDLVDFVGVQPDFTFSAADDGCGEALLCAEIDPVEVERLAETVNWFGGVGWLWL